MVPPEPTNCPAGSLGSTCHGGPYCGVHSCAPSCSAGLTCQAVQLCIAVLNCGPYPVDSVKGTCAGGGACAVGTCKTVQACAPAGPRPDAKPSQPDGKPSQPDGKSSRPDGKGSQEGGKGAPGDGAAAPASRGCKCGLAEAEAGSPVWLALVAAAILLAARRRRRA